MILAKRKKAALISLIIGVMMFVGKITAYFLTNSAAIFSDALESVIHVAATSMAYYSIVLSSIPEDSEHPYGHGKIEFFSAGTEGILIIIAALFIIYYSVHDIIFGSHLSRLDVGVMIVAAAGLVNLFLGLYLIKTGKKTNSLTLVADGKHVLTDSVTSLGAIVGILLVILTDIALFDPIFAIFLAVNILITGYKLVRESFGGLMNEMDLDILKRIIEKIIDTRKENWIDIHRLRFWKSGDKVFIDFHLILPFYMTIKESHLVEEEITDVLKTEFSSVDLKLHLDYCLPVHCKICSVKDCKERSELQTSKSEWSREKLCGKPIHKFISA